MSMPGDHWLKVPYKYCTAVVTRKVGALFKVLKDISIVWNMNSSTSERHVLLENIGHFLWCGLKVNRKVISALGLSMNDFHNYWQ